MASARQSTIRHFLGLSVFSLPAVAVSVVLLILPHWQKRIAVASLGSALQVTPVVNLPGPTPNIGFGIVLLPQKPEVTPSRPRFVTVAAGYSLWKIAREIYGNGRDYHVILDANRSAIAKPELIQPGQQFALPDKKAN